MSGLPLLAFVVVVLIRLAWHLGCQKLAAGIKEQPRCQWSDQRQLVNRLYFR
jgi:hypothetical protein